VVAAAYEERAMIHQVVAPAGSSLLFTEALLHATGQVRSRALTPRRTRRIKTGIQERERERERVHPRPAGQVRSDRERAIIIAGYGTTYFPWKVCAAPGRR
jgi:hypothetical protein